MVKRAAAGGKQELAGPAAALLAWYDVARRDLPWRAKPGELPDPYRVWLSEIMLQQTTVAAVKPYFAAFTSRWPTVGSLAAAPIEEVMAAWAGLGYYSRARNLVACARAVATDHGGAFPADEAALLKLPGIGPYTAAAIAAIAFGRRAVVVDGNVERVVTRFFALTDPLPGSRPAIRMLTDRLTPDDRAGDFAQAMMDLGATICTPRSPACILCPLTEGCEGRAKGIAAELPAKLRKAAKTTRRGAAFVLRDGAGRLLVRRRADKGLLGGMLEVPGTEWVVGRGIPDTPEGAPLAAPWLNMGSVTHVFTHFTLELTVFAAEVPYGTAAPVGGHWLAPEAIAAEAFPNVMRKVLARADG